MTKTLAGLLLFLTLCNPIETEAEASISRNTVSMAWKRITQADSFPEIAIHFENDSEPNAWVMFRGENDYSVHVTTGLTELLCTEDEIAGVLGHELGHIRLGHYEADILTDTVRVLMNSNTHDADSLTHAVSSINLELRESSFSREQETQADEYGSALLVRAGYDSRGLYNAIKRFADKGLISGSKSGGFSSHPAGHERLSHLAELAGASGVNDSELDELANILLGDK